MKNLWKSVSAMAAVVLLAGSAASADVVSSGKVKVIHPDKKNFVLTDAAGKDWTIKFGDNVVINRGGKESQSDLNAGDAVNVCHDKGVLTWTAHYILVQEGDTKNCELMHGTVKSYDASKKELAFTDDQAKDCTLALGNAKVRLNRQPSKVEDIKIGDHTLAIVEKRGDIVTLQCLMVDRK
jgi:hypothetical protein